MKKLVLSSLFFMAMIAVIAQTVPRDMVAMEIGTGTWCTYCPGAAMGADDLLENGCRVAVIENHNGDSYANTYSNTRNSYYTITGYPTAIFDGVTRVVGGSHSNSMYTSYLPKYNQRINIPANMFLEMEVTNSGQDYTAVITMTKVGTIAKTDLKLHFFVTQSNIQQNWQGQTHLEHVNRLMVPGTNGTDISFTSGNEQTATLNWTMDAAWPLEDCEFIAFVQSQSSKECFNAFKQATIDLNVDFTASETSIQKNDVVTFTNSTFGGYIGTPETYEWILPGTDIVTSTDKEPVATYINGGLFDVTLIVNRGGQIDTVVKTDYIDVAFGVGVEGKDNVNVSVRPNPSNGTFMLELNTGKSMVADITITNMTGTVVYSLTDLSINGQLTRNIRLENAAPGTYFLNLRSGETKITKKIIVK